jgi:hypothetical protein
MPSRFGQAKEPKLEGTLDGTSPSGTEVPTECHALMKQSTGISKGYRDGQVMSSLEN